jgi:hypothetical protein
MSVGAGAFAVHTSDGENPGDGEKKDGERDKDAVDDAGKKKKKV